MFKILKKISACNKGFTLTEVLIAITILTVAIVAATDLLMGIISSNKNNVKSLQAYYIAQEGLEAVRNIRDTNWLHNVNWLSKDSKALWGAEFEKGKKYTIEVIENPTVYTGGTILSNTAADSNIASIKAYALFSVHEDSVPTISAEGEFSRVIFILNCLDSESDFESDSESDSENDCVRVQAKVTWKDGTREKEVVLETILTNWKSGAI